MAEDKGGWAESTGTKGAISSNLSAWANDRTHDSHLGDSPRTWPAISPALVQSPVETTCCSQLSPTRSFSLSALSLASCLTDGVGCELSSAKKSTRLPFVGVLGEVSEPCSDRFGADSGLLFKSFQASSYLEWLSSHM